MQFILNFQIILLVFFSPIKIHQKENFFIKPISILFSKLGVSLENFDGNRVRPVLFILTPFFNLNKESFEFSTSFKFFSLFNKTKILKHVSFFIPESAKNFKKELKSKILLNLINNKIENSLIPVNLKIFEPALKFLMSSW